MKRYIEKVLKIIENKNLIPKLGSIILAVILWAYISSSKSGDVRFKLPVTFTGLEENLVISKLSHKVVVVEVQGNKDDLKNISSKNIKLMVDLSKVEPGEYKPYTIQYQKIDVTDDFKIELYPEEVKVLIEKKVSRNVKVIPKFTGNPEKGFMTGKPKVYPDAVKITGPRSVINSIGVLYTEEIPVDNRNAPFKNDFKIMKTAIEDGLEFSISKVNVAVPVQSYSGTITYEIPVAIRNKKKGFNYLLITDRVRISYVPVENKTATERSFTAYIDCDEIDVDNDEFLKNSRIEVIGFVHVNGDSYETDNGILSATPEIVEIVVTKE
jgi:YbbR domain-containing protein